MENLISKIPKNILFQIKKISKFSLQFSFQLEKLDAIRLEVLANLENSDDEEPDEIYQNSCASYVIVETLSNNENQNADFESNVEIMKKENSQENPLTKRTINERLCNLENKTNSNEEIVELKKIQKKRTNDERMCILENLTDSINEFAKQDRIPSKKRKTKDKNVCNLENVTSPDSSLQNCEESEFDLFGKYIAMQLKSLPFENALELEAKIHSIISETRLKIYQSKIEKSK